MKRKIQIIISASVASVLAYSALAQDAPLPKADGLNYAHDGTSPARRAARLNDAAKASDVIGMTVKNNQDEKLGKVEDLAVDIAAGRIVQVIPSPGGFIGLGNSLTALPPEALHSYFGLKGPHLDAD